MKCTIVLANDCTNSCFYSIRYKLMSHSKTHLFRPPCKPKVHPKDVTAMKCVFSFKYFRNLNHVTSCPS